MPGNSLDDDLESITSSTSSTSSLSSLSSLSSILSSDPNPPDTIGLGLGYPRSRDQSSGGYIGRSASTKPHYVHTTSTSSLVASPPKETPAAFLKAAGVEKEVKRKSELLVGLGPLDDAMEREIELEMLRKENAELRRLLFEGSV